MSGLLFVHKNEKPAVFSLLKGGWFFYTFIYMGRILSF